MLLLGIESQQKRQNHDGDGLVTIEVVAHVGQEVGLPAELIPQITI